MSKILRVLCVALAAIGSVARPASADWLLSGFVSPLFNVKTSATNDNAIPAEKFDSSSGFGVNLASAFPTRGNLGFEIDFGYYPDALKTSNLAGEDYASKLMTIAPNFFYSPAIPRWRPYFSIGPSFGYRSDHADAENEIPSGWAAGINAGGGLVAFLTERFGARFDVRYFRNFGDFYDISTNADERGNGWNNLQFMRMFFGGTFVL